MASSSSSNYNGILYPAGQPVLTADNRGFRYGDGLFETMFVQKGRIRLGEYHFDRLLSGMRLLDFDFPPFFVEKLIKEVIELYDVNTLSIAIPSRCLPVAFR